MATTTTHRVGDFVLYQGSQHRFSGWTMKITAVHGDRLNLSGDRGVRLSNVRTTSVR